MFNIGIYVYMFLFILCILLNIFIVYAMHELRGSFYEAYEIHLEGVNRYTS